MRTVQVTLDEEMVDAVDRMAKKLGTTRSAFTREALRAALVRSRELEMERKHREGYLRKPPKPGEFEVWEKEQIWGTGNVVVDGSAAPGVRCVRTDP